MDDSMKRALGDFVGAIKETGEYRQYVREKERVAKMPELKRQIDEFRRRNYEMQIQSGDEELFEKLERFEAEYAAFREDPMVDDFLAAELAFCRMMQEMNVEITGALDFD